MGIRKRTVGLVAAVIFAILLLAIIHILTAGHPIFFASGRHMRASADLQMIQSMLQIYKAENGSYPTTEQGLAALVDKPTLPRMSALPKDPWQNDYVYRCPGRTRPGEYDLFSPGPDRIPYTADDDWGQ